MMRTLLAIALATMIPTAVRGEPIAIAVHSSAGGFSAGGDITAAWTNIDLGTLSMDGHSSGTFFFSNAKPWRDYTVSFNLQGTGMNNLRVEVLDPLGDGDDAFDPADAPASLPAGYSTSNNRDGLSFAQGSGLERSATFAGGTSMGSADESTHRGDILVFAGLEGIEHALVKFGLRDSRGGRGFLLRFTAEGSHPSPVPEPASMVLIGTGLAGLAVARRRRRASIASQTR